MQKKALYIRTSKTGSSTITEWCKPYQIPYTNNVRFLSFEENVTLFDCHFKNDDFIFTSIRNPYERAISCWQQAIISDWVERECTFEKFLDLDFKTLEKEHAQTHLIPLTEYLEPVLDKIQFIIRLENLENCLKKLSDTLEIKYHTPGHVYSGGYDKKSFSNKYLNPLNKKKIEEKYKTDFEYFGY